VRPQYSPNLPLVNKRERTGPSRLVVVIVVVVVVVVFVVIVVVVVAAAKFAI